VGIERLPRALSVGLLIGACAPTKSASTPGTQGSLERTSSMPQSRPANRLAREKSPYLLQHAHNPVDWYPWGEEAFEKARRENKPIFLSVGYSTCHWCHVMERESFENEIIGKFLSEHFVPVKVDREERPDVDRVYMAFVQASTGSGGWPMSVWLTPDLKPFYGGTYFAPVSAYGRPGFLDLLKRIEELWRTKSADLQQSAARALDVLREQTQVSAPESAPAEAPVSDAMLRRGFDAFDRSFDGRHGGFGGAPKFPRPSTLFFLLRYAQREKNERATQMATLTLEQMARGGMYDQLGGGFHRYSVDAVWHVPHFEKMLYDQGQLAAAYAEAFQATGKPLFATTLRGICDYVMRDLTSPDGAFFSAEDADSADPDAASQPADGHGVEKREGAFYVFTHEELSRIAGADAAAFGLRFGVEESGNASDPHGELTGRNVLFLAREISEVATRLSISEREATDAIARASAKALAERARRPRPHLDDKVLTAWNGLMISGLAKAAAALDEPRYGEAAARAARFIEARMFDSKSGELRRRYRDGEVGLRAHADDYAYFVQGLLDLYAWNFDARWIDLASKLHATMDRLFRDSRGVYYSSAEGDASILIRMQEDYDGAEPSPSSIAAHNALVLAELTGDDELRKRAEETVTAFRTRLSQIPAAVPQMLATLDAMLASAQHIGIAGDPSREDTRALLRAVRGRFLPNAHILLADGGEAQTAMAKRLPFVAGMKPVGGKAAAYVCVNRACRLPTTDPREIEKLFPR